MNAPASQTAAAQPGEAPEIFGKYEILRPLARGGMAEIFLARARGIEGFERVEVIKRIRPELSREPQMVEMFLDEARVLAGLQHSNIVQVYEFGAAAGSYFLALEFLHGENVSSLVRRSGRLGADLPLEHALFIVTSTLAGLHFAHEKIGPDGQPLRIVHRDVSPSNIMVTFDGDVKLLDFGIAKASIKRSMTQAGVVKGKWRYMSPEQCLMQEVDRRSDVFACSIVLWELTTQHRLFSGKSDYEIMKRVVEDEIPRPSSVRPGYPAELEQIVMRGLRRAPGERYQTAQDMRADLEHFARERRLATSSLALATHMKALFSDRVQAWELARQAGRTFAEHIAEASLEATSGVTGERSNSALSGERAIVRRPFASLADALSEDLGAREGSARRPVEAQGKPSRRTLVLAGFGAGIVVFMGLGFTLLRGITTPEAPPPAAQPTAPQPAARQPVAATKEAPPAPAPSDSPTAAAASQSAEIAHSAAEPAPPAKKTTSPPPAPRPPAKPARPAKPPEWDKDSPFMPP